jgi:hypothetical protein
VANGGEILYVSCMNAVSRQPLFCTACGEKLENFCFSPEAKDLEALRAHAFRCHVEGRYAGGMCAALYIADDAHPAQPGTPDAAPPQHRPVSEEALRAAIVARIARDGEGLPDGSPPDGGPAA